MDEVIKGLADGVKDIGARLDKVPTMEDFEKNIAASRAAQEEATAVKEQLGVAQSDLVGLRKMLEHNLGKSGAQDFRQTLEHFIKAAWHEKKGKKAPTWLEKATSDYFAHGDQNVNRDAQGGFLVPRLVADEIIKLTLAHGDIWPLLNKLTMQPGTTMRYPHEVTLASVAFRRLQGAATTEVDPAVVWGADVIGMQYLGGYVKVANEAFTSQGLSIPDNIVMQFIDQIIRKAEWAVCKANKGTPTQGTGYTGPKDGLLVNSNVQSQTEAATVTLALIDKFIGECVNDHEGSVNTRENYLLTTGAVAHQLKTGLTQQGLDWGNVAKGWFPELRGYSFVTTPHLTLAGGGVHGTAVRNWIVMSPLRKITVAWPGTFAVDFNDRGEGWTQNETWIMCNTHLDFTLGNPLMHHKAVFTALS